MKLDKKVKQLKPSRHTLPNGGEALLIGSKMVAYRRTPLQGDMFDGWDWVHKTFRITS